MAHFRDHYSSNPQRERDWGEVIIDIVRLSHGGVVQASEQASGKK
jgi:hypothetical protein